jgi:transcriptional regulator with XRE-family HTH domain
MNLGVYIGNIIKDLREKHNMTQDDLAIKLNITRQSISRYENGERKINQDTLFELAQLFNTSINTFFPPTQKNTSNVTTHLQKEQTPAEDYNFFNKTDVSIAREYLAYFDLQGARFYTSRTFNYDSLSDDEVIELANDLKRYKDKNRGTWFIRTRIKLFDGNSKEVTKRGFRTKAAAQQEKHLIKMGKSEVTRYHSFTDIAYHHLEDSKLRTKDSTD